MKKKLSVLLVGALVVLWVASAGATVIDYTITDSIGPTYSLSFTVHNDTLSSNIEWFSIYFGQTTDGLDFANYNQFSSFVPGANPPGWLAYSFEPSSINQPGQFNADGLSSVIVPGGTQGGFNITFDWTAVGSYDHLFFEVGNFSGADYVVLDTGYTQRQDTTVPEPASLLLLGTGLIGGLLWRRRRA